MIKIKLTNLHFWLLISVTLFGLNACVALGFKEKYVWHSFSFDTQHDSPDAEVLDYQYGSSRNDPPPFPQQRMAMGQHYGTSKREGIHPDKERIAMGQNFAYYDTSGYLPVGDFLYVNWRIKNPIRFWEYIGYYEDKVDLKKRLPADITNHRIHFVIKGPQLYVYLILPGLKAASEPTGPVRMYPLQKQIQIYPDQPK